MSKSILGFALLTIAVASSFSAAVPSYPEPVRVLPERVDRLVFAPHPKHNHGSCIVELSNRDLLACWYRGSGERTADDVAVYGSIFRKSTANWSQPFILADTPNLPDTNPFLTVAPSGKVMLFYNTIQDNQWESALLKMKVGRYDSRGGKVNWERSDVVHLRPDPEFGPIVRSQAERILPQYLAVVPEAERGRLFQLRDKYITRSFDTLYVRLGWMGRAHPIWLPNGTLLIGLYSDGFDCSLWASTSDEGATWTTSEPAVGAGNVQPSMVQRKDGTLVAYFRDNGPPPSRVMTAESKDGGMRWSPVTDTAVVDTGAGVEAIRLKSGRWLLINNDLTRGRHRLSIHLSDDEGKTWPRVARIEDDSADEEKGSYSYPSILQSRDGRIHITYSYNPVGKSARKEGKGECIKHVTISEAWLLANSKPVEPPPAER